APASQKVEVEAEGVPEKWNMVLLYDGSFDGFLSVLFDVYAQKITPEDIGKETHYQSDFFSEKLRISTQPLHAQRVWAGWQKKLSKPLKQLPLLAFLSEENGMEMKLYHFARLSFASPIPVDGNFADPAVLDIRKAARRVSQEAMRMIQFARFQQTRDGIYFAGLLPRYDVLPMTVNHFRDRFADQNWLVYDMKRDYGFFYNRQTIDEVTLSDKKFCATTGRLQPDVLMEGEAAYQRLWNHYYRHITIRERLNLKCHKNLLPKRYWNLLTEKIP
nr:TIGR03915 family putative DNA repair protein [Prolixibacteraceae bacterium]